MKVSLLESLRRPNLLMNALCLLGSFFSAQTMLAISYPDQLASRGVDPSGSYYFDKLESINKTSGNLTYRIPLTAMPMGRGGFSIPVALTYNSTQFDYQYFYTSGGDYPASPVLNQTLTASPWGGWSLTVGYSIFVEQKAVTSSCSNSSDSYLTFRSSLIAPDGSHHILHIYKQLDDGNGFYLNDFYGTPSCAGTAQLTGDVLFSTEDGSFIKVVSHTGTGLWTVYLNDGTSYDELGYNTSTETNSSVFSDRNGNKINLKTQSQNGGSQSVLTDDEGRTITITVVTPGVEFLVSQTGPNNAPLTWHFAPSTAKSAVSFQYTCQPQNGTACNGSISGGGVDVLQTPGRDANHPLNYTFTYGQKNGELQSVTLPTGATTNYAYALPDYTVNFPEQLQNPIVAKQVVWNDAADGNNVQRTEPWTYSYGNQNNIQTFAATAPDGGTQTTYLTGLKNTLTMAVVEPSGSRTDYGYRNNRPYYAAYPTGASPGGETNPYMAVEIHTMANGGSPTSSAITTHTVDKNGNPITDTSYDWIPYTSISRDSNGFPTWTSNGTLLRSVTRAYNVTTATAGTGSEAIADDPNAYWNPSSPKLRDLLVSSITSGPGVGAFIQYSYDANGNQLQELDWDSTKSSSQPTQLNSSNAIVTTRTYDGYGNLLTVTDPNGNKNKYTYDSNSLYAVKFVIASGSSQPRHFAYSWDQNAGLMDSKTDSDNKLTTTYSYDNLGRQTLAAITASGQSWSETQTRYDDQSLRVVVQNDQTNFADGLLINITTYDQLGRVALTQQLETGNISSATDPTAGIKVQTRYLYSGSNLYKLVSNPYRSATSTAASSEMAMGWTVTTFDQDGRTASTQSSDGSSLPAPWGSNSNTSGTVQTAYNSQTQVITDQAQKIRQMTMDGLGRLANATQDPGGLNIAASYTYDAQDDLSTVTQGSQARSFSYSSLKRLGSAINPESGATTYLYDNNGNLTQKTDARNTQTVLTYDALNRIQRKDYSDGTPSVVYVYDAGAYGIGQLYSVVANPGGSSYEASSFVEARDPNGNILNFARAIEAGNSYTQFNFTNTYNLAGALTSVQYPSGRVVKTTYDLANRAQSVSGQPSSGTPTTYAASVSYAPHGEASSYAYPSGLNVQYGFNSRLQICQIEHFFPPGGQPQTPLEDDVYWTFTEPHCGVASNNNGNVDHVETYNGGTPAYPQFIVFLQYFGYDNANRLSSAQESNVSGHMGPYPVDWSRNFNYDQYGNMWVTNASGINPAGNTPSAQSNYQASTNQFISALASYDAAGNQLSANGNQVSYDAENRQTSVQSGSSIIGTYSYDGEGNRVVRTTAAGTTVYVYDAANQLAAEYSTSAAIAAPCKTCYFHRDHLGSVRLVTDSGGNAIARHDFLPFGEEIPAGIPAGVTGRTDATWAASDDVNQKFTGKERDEESGLDYFNARYYGSALGRFTSPDPMGIFFADPADPQSWNLYSYVLNNPLSNIDPSGYSCTNLTNSDGSQFQGDNGDGQGCAGAGVNPSNQQQRQNNSDIQPYETNVNTQQGSLLDYIGTISTNEIPRYDPNDVPLNNYARQIFTRVGRMLPTTCGGGVYVYAGKELDGGGVNGFAGAITEFDSRDGVSKGALFEGGAGEGVVGGGGYVATTNSKGQVSTSGLGYFGAGAHAGVAGGSAGGVVFSTGAGVYAEGSLFGRAAGVGAYANVTTNGACDSGQK